MSRKLAMAFFLGLLFFYQSAYTSPITVSPTGEGRPDSKRAPVLTFSPSLGWFPGAGVGAYEVIIMELDESSIISVPVPKKMIHRRTDITGTGYVLPVGVLQPDRLYSWFVMAAKPELQSSNHSLLYFRTSATEPRPGGSFQEIGTIEPVIATLTPLLEWPHLGKSQYSITITEHISPGVKEKVVLKRSGISDPFFQVPPNVLRNGVKYFWNVSASGMTPVFRQFQTHNDPLKAGLPSLVKLTAGYGIGFKIAGGKPPYHFAARNQKIAYMFTLSTGSDYQINALSEGYTNILVFDNAVPTPQQILIPVLVTSK